MKLQKISAIQDIIQNAHDYNKYTLVSYSHASKRKNGFCFFCCPVLREQERKRKDNIVILYLFSNQDPPFFTSSCDSLLQKGTKELPWLPAMFLLIWLWLQAIKNQEKTSIWSIIALEKRKRNSSPSIYRLAATIKSLSPSTSQFSRCPGLPSETRILSLFLLLIAHASLMIVGY